MQDSQERDESGPEDSLYVKSSWVSMEFLHARIPQKERYSGSK